MVYRIFQSDACSTSKVAKNYFFLNSFSVPMLSPEVEFSSGIESEVEVTTEEVTDDATEDEPESYETDYLEFSSKETQCNLFQPLPVFMNLANFIILPATPGYPVLHWFL